MRLPNTWNTLKQRRVTVDPYAPIAAPADKLRPLNGMDGAPRALHPELADVLVPYWNRPSGSGADDGAHVDIVRVGPTSGCDLGLDRLFPNPAANPDDPNQYRFTALDAAVRSASDVGGEGIVVQLGFSRCATDLEAELDRAATWASVGAHVIRHLVGGSSWDPRGLTAPVVAVELLDDPLYTYHLAEADRERAFDLFAAMAHALRTTYPDGKPLIAGPSVRIGGARDVTTAGTSIAAFLARADAFPLDVLSYRVADDDPRAAAAIGKALRARLDALGRTTTELFLTEMTPVTPPGFPTPWTAEGDGAWLAAAHLGAYEASARAYLQDVPVSWALSGLGPWTFADGADHAFQPLAQSEELLVPSAYFTREGLPTPAFMLRLPIRQFAGKRVTTESDADLAVVATHDGFVLHILIAASHVEAGVAAVDYELNVPAFVPAAVRRVGYRFAELDQGNRSLGSFFFSDLGTLEPSLRSGDLVIRRTIPVPGVHYLEIVRPDPSGTFTTP